MTPANLKRMIDELDRRFQELDYERITAINNGDYEKAQEIEKQQDKIFEKVEELRSM